jgi:hypothetical protein
MDAARNLYLTSCLMDITKEPLYLVWEIRMKVDHKHNYKLSMENIYVFTVTDLVNSAKRRGQIGQI